MRILLDTHALLWWFADDPSLSSSARQIVADTENEIFVSPASGWEIATKFAKGRLPTAAAINPNLSQIIVDEGFVHLPLTLDHMVRSAFVDGEHRDPFDRILAAQGIAENLLVLTTDDKISELGADVVW